ncbi:MAG: S24/S26 family peptidase [Clostridia bacterium]|nr:S24/S26 family peptidase [Clostridia bacterium]
MHRRMVDTKEYVDVLRGLTQEGKEVSMLVAGSSMNPFLIHYRDTIYFKKPDRALRRGDMVFYQRDSGQYVMHRILRVKPEGLYIVGDAQTEIEGPVRPDQVFAVVTRVRRKGKMIGPGDFWWKFFEGPWLCIVPLRRVIMRLYALPRKKTKKA